MWNRLSEENVMEDIFSSPIGDLSVSINSNEEDIRTQSSFTIILNTIDIDENTKYQIYVNNDQIQYEKNEIICDFISKLKEFLIEEIAWYVYEHDDEYHID